MSACPFSMQSSRDGRRPRRQQGAKQRQAAESLLCILVARVARRTRLSEDRFVASKTVGPAKPWGQSVLINPSGSSTSTAKSQKVGSIMIRPREMAGDSATPNLFRPADRLCPGLLHLILKGWVDMCLIAGDDRSDIEFLSGHFIAR